MDREEYWQHFMATGSVEDYLLYAGCIDREEGEEKTKDKEADKEKEHAGQRFDIGNHTTDGAYRGIR